MPAIRVQLAQCARAGLLAVFIVNPDFARADPVAATRIIRGTHFNLRFGNLTHAPQEIGETLWVVPTTQGRTIDGGFISAVRGALGEPEFFADFDRDKIAGKYEYGTGTLVTAKTGQKVFLGVMYANYRNPPAVADRTAFEANSISEGVREALLAAEQAGLRRVVLPTVGFDPRSHLTLEQSIAVAMTAVESFRQAHPDSKLLTVDMYYYPPDPKAVDAYKSQIRELPLYRDFFLEGNYRRAATPLLTSHAELNVRTRKSHERCLIDVERLPPPSPNNPFVGL